MDLPTGLSDFLANPPLAALAVFLISGWALCPLLALWARLAEAARRRVFYNHLSRQICQAALAAALPALAGLSVLAALRFLREEPLPAQAHISALPGLALFAACLLLPLLCLLTWKRLRKAAALQTAALALAALAALGAASLILAALILPPESASPDLILEAARLSLFNADHRALWAFALVLLLVSLGLTAAWSVCWLLLRRGRDDFGRDYYNFAVSRSCAMAFAAGAAALLAFGAWLGLIWAGYFPATPPGSLPGPAMPLAAAALLVVCCAVWLTTARAASPLRRKAALWGALPLWAGALVIVFQVAQTCFQAALAR